MKKTIIIIAVVLIILAAIALGLVWYFVWNDSGYIGRDAAEAAALADAGLAASEVSRLRSSFERDDGELRLRRARVRVRHRPCERLRPARRGGERLRLTEKAPGRWPGAPRFS